MRKIFYTLFALLTFFRLDTLNAQDLSPGKLEEMIQKCIMKTRAASICIYEYDTIAARIIGPQFSGVVVSKNGQVLTAAHACEPKKVYLVIFPDGSEHIGTGLGSIQSIDAAVLKIKSEGPFPYAEMGTSQTLRVNEPCISIAYPGSFSFKIPVVRFGHVAEVLNAEKQMVRTTCLMEPGDSGGPVFDLYGRVIGICSSIDLGLESNFEVPIDLFRKYWSALVRPIDYVRLPQEDSIPAPTSANRASPFSGPKLLKSLAALEGQLDDNTVPLTNIPDGAKAVGTLLKVDVNKIKNSEKKCFIISKSSLLKSDNVGVMINGKSQITKVIYRDAMSDLILLEWSNGGNTGINLSQVSSDTLSMSQLGKILISPNPLNEGEISVLGTIEIGLKETFNMGYLGSGVELKKGINIIAAVQPNSPADKAGILFGDEIISVNGVEVPTPDLFVDEVQKYKPNDILAFVFQRNGDKQTIEVKLGIRPQVTGSHIAEQFEDGKSERRDGFNRVYVHDSKLKPAECGGPVFDLEGKFMGINIARYSRTSSIAISPAGIKVFLKEAFANSSVKL